MQRDINHTMRGILVDWLVEVAEEYKLVPETLFLAVNFIDRCLSKYSCQRSSLQLVGVTCMLIAAKFEEIYAPQVSSALPFPPSVAQMSLLRRGVGRFGDAAIEKQ